MAEVSFGAKLLTTEDNKPRERDAWVYFANGYLMVTLQSDQKMLVSVPTNAVVGVIYSKSKQPLWDAPSGAAPIERVDSGPFGFFRSGRHWVSLRTKERFIILRIEENQVPTVLSAIESRTGKTVVRLTEPRNDE
jgi:hypothetical protein